MKTTDMTNATQLAATTALAMLFTLGLIVTGCDDASMQQGTGSSTSPSADTPSDAPDVVTYTVRGKIAALPVAGDARTELMIHHEPINDYQNSKGEVVGMSSMVMPFAPADGVSLQGLAVGDIVTFTFGPGIEIQSIEKLPADTELNFGKAVVPHQDQPMDHGDHAGHGH